MRGSFEQSLKHTGRLKTFLKKVDWKVEIQDLDGFSRIHRMSLVGRPHMISLGVTILSETGRAFGLRKHLLKGCPELTPKGWCFLAPMNFMKRSYLEDPGR